MLRNFHKHLFDRTPMDTSGQNHFDNQSLYFYKNILSIFLKYNLLYKQVGPGSSLKVSCILKIFRAQSCFSGRNDFQGSICSQCTVSLPPENIRKPYGFLMFSGGRERVHWENKWIKSLTKLTNLSIPVTFQHSSLTYC